MWRLAHKADTPQIMAIHVAQEQRLGRTVDLPNLFSRPTLVTLVREEEGRLTHFVFLEAEAEVCAAGESGISKEEWNQVSEILSKVLSAYRIRIVRSFVPSELVSQKEIKGRKKDSPIPRLLKRLGFNKENQSITSFYKWMGE